MTVPTFTQPDNTMQTGSAYKTAIDGAIAVHHRIAGAFACHQNDQGSPDAPDMTVRVDAGAIAASGSTPTEVAAQSTSALAAPSGNPRNDVVYYDNGTGTVGVAQGAEAASPSDPAVPAGKTPIARVRLTVGMTEITNADIDDLRTGGSAPVFTGPDISGSPQLDGSAGLVPQPTVADAGKYLRTDGWAAVTDQVARNMGASAMALANANGVAGPVGAFLLADPFTSDTLAVKTGATYDSGNDWYSNAGAIGSTNRVSGIAPTTNATTLGGALSDVTDGANVDEWYATDSYTSAIAAGKYLQWDLTTPRRIRQVKIIQRGGSGTNQHTLQYSDDASSWTTLSTQTHATTVGSFITIDFGDPGSSHRYWRLLPGGAASASNWGYHEVEMYEQGAATNMTLRPTPATLLTADPLDVMFYGLFDPVDSVTMGTDVIGKVSIADGSPEDFVTGAWTQVGTYGNFELWRLDVDLSGKTGSTLEYSIETVNNKEIRFKQSVGCVPLY